MRTIGLAIIILATLTVDSYPCVCDKFDHRQYIKEADYVFVGQAIKNLHADSVVALLLDERGTGTNISFKVEKVLKGKIQKETIAIIQRNGNCAMGFKLGGRYLIFGHRIEKVFGNAELMPVPVDVDSTELHGRDGINKEIYDEREILLRFENKIVKDYGLRVATSECSCFYEKGKTYRKYLRRKLTA